MTVRLWECASLLALCIGRGAALLSYQRIFVVRYAAKQDRIVLPTTTNEATVILSEVEGSQH
jgi:hypothetical protein